METEKNLHAMIPSTLLSEAERMAAEQHVTLDEWMRKAVQRAIEDSGWKRLYAYGEQQARKVGIKEEDVDRIIHEFREEERQRQNNESGH